MNRVTLMGRLATDVTLRQTQSGKAVATFRFATDNGKDSGGNRKPADFHNCVAWEKRAETAAKYLAKGRRALLEGRLQYREYEKDGVKRWTTEIIVGSIEFCDSKPEAAGNESADGGDAPTVEIPF